ncbi:hypothetical protein AZI98_08595 [Aeribacillus pallidus]|jgi:hypothetical protein|uniref:Sce7726 family protein n=1 Tax=Aeribacillus pallidus TaxID=33936 RepID=A0A165XWP9_9BACI|nr:sce7726 family protein [Aeribacillus pallidus]KZN96481.1 hypothetical protein AZI98_08595 [Aeribacillus pallidus]
MEKLKDQDIRKVLLEELNKKYYHDPETRIVNEMGIHNGRSRVDIAVINGILHGYEIKSESDTLTRLPRQMDYYNRLFERMTIVVDKKYFEEVKELVPHWWGIILVNKTNTGVRLVQKRKGRKVASQDKELLLNLLWKKELEGFVDFLGYPKSMKKLRKGLLFELILKECDIKTIREYVYSTLKNREPWLN